MRRYIVNGFIIIITLVMLTACGLVNRRPIVKPTGESISLGISKAEVIRRWGEPAKVNKSVGSWGVHEQWVYGYHPLGNITRTIPTQFLYFENGKLTSWQDL